MPKVLPLTQDIQNTTSLPAIINLFKNASDSILGSANNALFNYTELRKMYIAIKHSNLSNEDKLNYIKDIKNIYQKLSNINPENHAMIKSIKHYKASISGVFHQPHHSAHAVKRLFSEMELSNPEDEYFSTQMYPS